MELPDPVSSTRQIYPAPSDSAWIYQDCSVPIYRPIRDVVSSFMSCLNPLLTADKSANYNFV